MWQRSGKVGGGGEARQELIALAELVTSSSQGKNTSCAEAENASLLSREVCDFIKPALSAGL